MCGRRANIWMQLKVWASDLKWLAEITSFSECHYIPIVFFKTWTYEPNLIQEKEWGIVIEKRGSAACYSKPNEEAEVGDRNFGLS